MARSLGSLTVDLLVKMGGFQKGMDAAARAADQRSRQITASFARVGRVLATVGVGFSGVAIARSLIQAGRAAIEYGDEIQKAADKTGIAASDISELAFAANASSEISSAAMPVFAEAFCISSP